MRMATLMMTLAVCAAAIPAHAQETASAAIILITDRTEFDGSYPAAKRVDFSPAAGEIAPFRVEGVRVVGGGNEPQVVDSLVGFPADFWFGAQTTSPDFLVTNLAVQFEFPVDVDAIGFDLQCFACDLPGQPTPIMAIVLNAAGEFMGYQQDYPADLTGEPPGNPAFLGLASDQKFRSVVFQRSGNWVLQNLRYVPHSRASIVPPESITDQRQGMSERSH